MFRGSALVRGMGGAELTASKLGFSIPLVGLYLAVGSKRFAENRQKRFQ